MRTIMALHRNRSFQVLITAILVALCAAPATSQELRTAHEESGFVEYTSYDQLMTFLQDVQATSADMLLSSFGTSMEGRVQPYAIFSRPLITQPWEAMVSGKPIVLIYANVHGGEKTLRESSPAAGQGAGHQGHGSERVPRRPGGACRSVGEPRRVRTLHTG